MAETIELKKRGPKEGSKHEVFVTLEELIKKFSDVSIKIPINKKFAELIGLNGVHMEKPEYKTEIVPTFDTIPAPKPQVDLQVINFND